MYMVRAVTNRPWLVQMLEVACPADVLLARLPVKVTLCVHSILTVRRDDSPGHLAPYIHVESSEPEVADSPDDSGTPNG